MRTLVVDHPLVAHKLTALRLGWLTQLARQDAARWENDFISAPRGSGLSVGSFQDPTTVLKELRPALTGDYEAIRNRLTALDTKAKDRREDVQQVARRVADDVDDAAGRVQHQVGRLAGQQQLGDHFKIDRVGLDRPPPTLHPALLTDMRRIQLHGLPPGRPPTRLITNTISLFLPPSRV